MFDKTTKSRTGGQANRRCSWLRQALNQLVAEATKVYACRLRASGRLHSTAPDGWPELERGTSETPVRSTVHRGLVCYCLCWIRQCPQTLQASVTSRSIPDRFLRTSRQFPHSQSATLNNALLPDYAGEQKSTSSIFHVQPDVETT